MSGYETRGIYGFAEEWFDKHGYAWKIRKSLRNSKIYMLEKEGVEFDYEIPNCVTNPELFMKFVDKYWWLTKRLMDAK